MCLSSLQYVSQISLVLYFQKNSSSVNCRCTAKRPRHVPYILCTCTSINSSKYTQRVQKHLCCTGHSTNGASSENTLCWSDTSGRLQRVHSASTTNPPSWCRLSHMHSISTGLYRVQTICIQQLTAQALCWAYLHSSALAISDKIQPLLPHRLENHPCGYEALPSDL